MRILIHAVNASLFPDADPSSITWTGPPAEIITIQSLLYASLATSLFAAFLAMLGKQWVNRYIRNRGGSATDESRDRQRKLDGLEKWHFRLTVESLPVMLRIALLLLGLALSLHLWTISRPIAWVIGAFTLFELTSYIFFTFAATLHCNCPCQTPDTRWLDLIHDCPLSINFPVASAFGVPSKLKALIIALLPYPPSQSSTLCTTISLVRVLPAGESPSRLPGIWSSSRFGRPGAEFGWDILTLLGASDS